MNHTALPFLPNTVLAEYALPDLLPLPKQPIHIDLGTGLGHFLEEMAQRAPNANWIGLESDGPILKRAVRRVRRASCNNARLFVMDARPFLLESVPPESLDHIWINFPDPWPKKKHASRRHTNPWMVGLMLSRLKPGGELHLATDVPGYLDEMRAGLAKFEGVKLAANTLWRRETLGVQTKYERKWLRQGKAITYADWRKTQPLALPDYPFDRQKPPDLPVFRLPPPGFYGEGRYALKILTARKTSSHLADFYFIDRQTGITTPGTINAQAGLIQLRGAWTSWKIKLAERICGFANG